MDNDAWTKFRYGGENSQLAQIYFNILTQKYRLQKTDFSGPKILKQDNGIYTYTWHNHANKEFVFVSPNADEACLSGVSHTKGLSCVTSEDWDSYHSRNR
jgi:hypothetical protein